MLIHNFLEKSAEQYPGKIAVIHDDDRITYGQLNIRVNQIAKHLIESGVNEGDRVAILLENSIDYITAYYATIKAGAVAAPLNPGLKPGGLKFLLNNLEPATIVTNFKAERLLKATDLDVPTLKSILIRTPKQNWPEASFNVSTFEEATFASSAAYPVSVNQDQSATFDTLASIIYTSGTTGVPKGVMLSHKNILSNTKSICQYLNITHNDIQMVVLPFFYVMGKSLLNTHVAAGATIVLNNRFMYPADVVRQMVEEKVTSFSGVPSTYAYLLNRSPLASSKDKLKHLRYCSQAGGHMAKSLKVDLRKALPEQTQIVIMYGATEASARLTYLAHDNFLEKMGSIGKAIPGVRMRVLNEEKIELQDGEEGELVGHGPNVMMGYWRDTQATRRVLSERGYHTGDLGYRDKDGFFFVTGRKDGLLKVSGHRINPTEIEDFLMSTDQLIEAAVIGIPDTLMGNKLVAIVVPKQDDQTPKDFLEMCTNSLPAHKIPAEVIITRTLPKNANGKVDRKQCMKVAQNYLQ